MVDPNEDVRRMRKILVHNFGGMCYVVHLSTTSDADLSQFDDEELALRFEAVPHGQNFEGSASCSYPHRWFLTRFGGCSCHFCFAYLNAESPEEFFAPHEDWMPQDDPDDILGMFAVYDVIEGLLLGGHAVDCVQIWESCETPDTPRPFEIRLQDVPRERFRFAADVVYRFVR